MHNYSNDAMRLVHLIMLLYFGSDVLHGENKDAVLGMIKTAYKESEIVYIIARESVTVYKKPKIYKMPRLAKTDIDMVVFYGESLRKFREKESDIKFFSGLSMRIIDNQVVTSSLAGRVSKAPLPEVETLLKALAKANGFKPIIQ